MLSHIFIGISDFERALRFYQAVLGEQGLGLKQRFLDRERPWAGWQPRDAVRPLFLIGRPFDAQAHAAGNGQMTAFSASSRAQVDEIFTLALEHGGSAEGEPGLRPDYHANYYGAYFRDPDGNKLCVVCHLPGVAA